MEKAGISSVQEPENVLAPNRKKRVGSLTLWERGNNMNRKLRNECRWTIRNPNVYIC